MKISIIVCTKDRPIDIQNLLNSLVAQSRKPFEILIVDGSDQPVKDVISSFQELLPLRYYSLRPPGLTKQRNYGINLVHADSEWVGFLDDDLVLDSNCIENLHEFLVEHQNLSGVGLCIYEQPKLKRSRWREWMLLDLYPGGRVTKSGSPATIRNYDENIQVEWLYGGATFWKKNCLQEFKFDEWYSGVGYFEDVDFSYRVSRQYQLAICAKAKCHHYHHAVPLEKMARLGEWLVVAWWYFARVKNRFYVPAIIWGIFFMSFNNLMMGILKNNPSRLRAFQGNLKGLGKILTGKASASKGFHK